MLLFSTRDEISIDQVFRSSQVVSKPCSILSCIDQFIHDSVKLILDILSLLLNVLILDPSLSNLLFHNFLKVRDPQNFRFFIIKIIDWLNIMSLVIRGQIALPDRVEQIHLSWDYPGLITFFR